MYYPHLHPLFGFYGKNTFFLIKWNKQKCSLELSRGRVTPRCFIWHPHPHPPVCWTELDFTRMVPLRAVLSVMGPVQLSLIQLRVNSVLVPPIPDTHRADNDFSWHIVGFERRGRTRPAACRPGFRHLSKDPRSQRQSVRPVPVIKRFSARCRTACQKRLLAELLFFAEFFQNC